jgi:hypothetical protein
MRLAAAAEAKGSLESIHRRQQLEALMRVMFGLVLLFVSIAVANAQSPEPPLSDTRLTVHTLVREDIFAGFMADDMARFSRGEKNIALLLEHRPRERGNLLAWQGSAAIYRAVLAHESGDHANFLKHLQAARAAFAEAATQTSGNDGAAAIAGGTYAVFADRLPEPERAAAWADAYANYSLLWKSQGSAIDKLPVHHRGEVLGGLVQSAQRTGRTEEMTRHLDRMIALLAGTPYEATAREWKANPASAATTRVTCKACHNPGRLSSTLASLQK